MLNVSFVLAILIEILLPFALAFWLVRRYHLKWLLFGVGMLTFIGSQAIHLPLLGLVTSFEREVILPALAPGLRPLAAAVVLGLLAGLCEEPARLVGYWLLKERGNSWGAALLLGAGHGGIESIGVGISVLVSFGVMLAAKAGGSAVPGVSQADTVAFWGMAWHLPLAGAVERLVAISLHLALSVMVWTAISQRRWWVFAAAVLWHAFIDSGAVLLASAGWPVWGIEGLLVITMLVNLGLLYYLRGWRGVMSNE